MRALWATCIVASLLPGFALAATLDVPIQVQQILPDGVSGRSWSGEPVSAGVPFRVDEGITDVRQLGMLGTRAAQFRATQRDPRTGNITWVLATFLADGGPYSLVAGSGAFGGSNLASETADAILISTGAATFEVRKHNFDVLDRVVVGSSELVARHTGGGIVASAAGVQYESGLDAASSVVLEENGPVMATVCARGTLRSAAGGTGFDYTARLHFYRGVATCRVFVTLRNADIASLAVRTFDAAWVELPVALGATREVTFGFPGTGYAASLGASGTAHLFQGDNTFQRSPRTDGIVSSLTSAAGLEVAINGTTYSALGTLSDVARGWMRLRDGSQAVFAGMRDLAAQFPSGFDVQGNRLAVDLFSRYNPNRNLIFSWGAHETRELLFDFTAASADPEQFRARLQYPLLGRCNFERYRDTGAIQGERRLVTAAEETAFYAALGKSWQPARMAETDIKYERQYSFSTTGGGNQFDQDECHLLDFLRTGYGGRFQQGRLGSLFKADQAVLHSDDFDYGVHENAVSDVRVDQPVTFHGKGAGSLFDDEHPHWTCMLIYYHLTGDEHVKEAIQDYLEWRRYRSGNPTYGPIHGGGLSHMRLWSRTFRDMALGYEFTGNARTLSDLETMARKLTTTVESSTSLGRNLERGYFYSEDPASDPTHNIHLFFLTEMNANGSQEALRVLRGAGSDALYEDLRDYMTGVAYFTLECQVTPAAIGYPYDYSAINANAAGTRGDQTGILLTHGYETTGDAEFINRARALTWHVAEYQHALRNSELPTHLRIYRWLHRNEMGAVDIEPSSARNSDGSYTLRWIAPLGATSYIAKYGARQLVDNLDFNVTTRAFAKDPASSMNFWAASNLTGEPAPAAAGTAQTFRTAVLPAGTWHFMVRALTDRPMGTLSTDNLRPDNPDVPGTGAPGQPQPGPGGSHSLGGDEQKPGGAPHVAAQLLSNGAGVRFTAVPSGARVRVYDVAGRLVQSVTGGTSTTATWDRRSQAGGRVAAGIYLFSVDLGNDGQQRGRIVLVP